MSSGIFFSATDKVKVNSYYQQSKYEGYKEKVTRYKTPQGELTQIDSVSPTGYQTIKYLIETKEDVDKFLSIPYVPIKENVSSFFLKERKNWEIGV